MYSTQSLKVPPLKPTMERRYCMNNALSGDGAMTSPKAENRFQTIFGAWNFVWEHFRRVPGSLASINNPLSVTVVHNDGIISPDFFKSLTSRKEQVTTDGMYIQNTPTKKPLNIIENIHGGMFDEERQYVTGIFTEGTINGFKPSSKYLDAKRNGLMRSDNEEATLEIPKEDFDVSMENDKSKIISENLVKEEPLEKNLNVIVNKIEATKDLENRTDGKDISTSKEILNCSGTSSNNSCLLSPEYNSSTNATTAKQAYQAANDATGISNLLTNMFHRVIEGVSDRLYPRAESIEQEVTMKPSASPKPRRKLCAIAKGRGRGRARSQLRRSGVSQTRHRKERSKHDLEVDIQDDFESWQEFDVYHTVQTVDSINCFSFDENTVSVSDGTEFIVQKTVDPISYTFADVKPRSRKPKARKLADRNGSKFPTRVRYVHECTLDTNAYNKDYTENKYDLQRNSYRPRLVSESSVDSEDSYCIVFETGSEVNYESDPELDDEESDVDQSTEDEESSASATQKVKFNLNPIVHVMVHWNYAYRAARRGPWEEMARDRERFKGRINCIGRVLNPILTVQHRNHIWQDRFAARK